MKKNVLLLIPAAALLFALAASGDTGFKKAQLKSSRVRGAYEHKESEVKKLFESKKMPYPPDEIFLRVFKSVLEDKKLQEPGEVELWARPDSKNRFVLIKTYKICMSSGSLGPKRQQGDGQVPEGFYEISNFNPYSSYHLAMKVDYPNLSDKKLGVRGDLGGDIFIHGNCVTIGCIPMTDTFIEEIYLIAVDTRNNSGKPIRCHIFPLRMKGEGMAALEKIAGSEPGLLVFWHNLRDGYLLFEKTNLLPKVTVDSKGQYIFAEGK
jgi:murein L,D-transpeptidase YafK